MDMSTRDAISLIARVRQRVNGVILTEISRHGMEGIVVSHGDVLYALFHRERMTMAEIADRIAKDKSTVTALVNKLISLGYVTKERDYMDARVVYASLTPKGRELQPVFEEISNQVMGLFYNHISEEEKQELIRILSKIENNFEKPE
jgi:DNA-binding MarR family transcriptional regulator